MRRAALLLLIAGAAAGLVADRGATPLLAAAAPSGPAPSGPTQAGPTQAGPSKAGPTEALTPERIEQFLEHADIVQSRPIGKGVTSPWRLTLSDGALTHDAAFQAVDRERENVRFRGGREEKLFRDYYGYNIAAYRLARLIGYDNLVPVSVERTWKGRKGALTWWVDKKWDEDERLKAGVEPPDRDAWDRQIYLARIFTALVQDTDRNLGNQLVTGDFHLWMIDFTRAFRRATTLEKPEYLRKIDRRLFERLKAIEPRQIAEAVRPWVEREELHALTARQKALVSHYTKAIEERGDGVFY
jgi:hypothetical protein